MIMTQKYRLLRKNGAFCRWTDPPITRNWDICPTPGRSAAQAQSFAVGPPRSARGASLDVPCPLRPSGGSRCSHACRPPLVRSSVGICCVHCPLRSLAPMHGWLAHYAGRALPCARAMPQACYMLHSFFPAGVRVAVREQTHSNALCYR
jgi:hypothetical protein